MKTLTVELIETLTSEGYTSIESLCWLNPDELADKVSIDKKKATEIIKEAVSLIDQKPLSAIELLAIEEEKKQISTGSTELNSLLGGGIYTGEITEISGEFASGKTQLCFQLSINVQLPEKDGGLSGSVYYIDTEGSFSPTRIAQIAQLNGFEPKQFLKNIAVDRTYNSDHLMYLILNADKIIKQRNVKLFIIDSIASHFRAEYVGDDKLVARQQVVMRLAETLKQIVENNDIAIVVTNQVIATIDESLFDKSPHPALGFAWAHRPHQRILLRKGRGQARIARMYDSSRLPDRECIFFVTEKGITDKQT